MRNWIDQSFNQISHIFDIQSRNEINRSIAQSNYPIQ